MNARVPAIACLVLGALLFLGGVATRRWGTLTGGNDGDVGLLDTACPAGPGACYRGWHGHTEPTRIEGKQFARLGELAFVCGILAALGALGAIHPRARHALGGPATLLALGAVGAATAFVVTEPFSQFGAYWRAGPGWWLFASGAALIAAGARLGPAETPRAIGRALPLALAAPMLALTATSLSWWRGTTDRTQPGAPKLAIGPAMVEECDVDLPCLQERLGDFATSGELAELPAPQADLMGTVADGVFPDVPRPKKLHATALVAGRAIAVTAAIAAALAAALAIAAAARRRARALAWATIGACGALLVALLVFEGASPDAAVQRLADVQRGFGLPMALVAIGLASIPALHLARDRAAAAAAPLAPAPEPAAVPLVVLDKSAPAATAAAIPPCPACRAPMLWVSKRKTWLCTVCKTRDSVTG